MGWASNYIKGLLAGETVRFRPRGNSMSGRIESGQLVTVEPVIGNYIAVDDIVLCRVGGAEYLHIVKAIKDGRYQIGNIRGHINGWTSNVFGKVTKVEP